eukprot:TRINITY_DN15_c0_g1_i2.p1 TRINITY_DN15_c0_g1~~TRINITY_DN15_c0_g1_i2.p1  ORF type:complete len:273 (-),score=45.43 TRINITY_DN15_c0_g1_i2:45-863(-)
MCIRDRYQRRVHGDFMRFIAILLLLAVANCREFHFFHHTGTLKHGTETQKVAGVIIVEMDNKRNMTYITGMVDGKNHHHHSFELGARIDSVSNLDGMVVKAHYVEGRMGKHVIKNIHGNVTLSGTWEKISYEGEASSQHGKDKIEIKAEGIKSKCIYYDMTEAASRAGLLVGENSHEYTEAQVLNFAIFGYPYLHNHNVTFYTTFGTKIESSKVGAVIVGSNHAAIVASGGNSFIHSSHETKGHIIESKLDEIKKYFPNGYVFRQYVCETEY